MPIVVAAVLVVAVAAFGLGSAVASRQAAPSPRTVAVVTPAPTPSPTPTPAPAATPTPPDIIPDAVSARLRSVYYNSIRGGWAVCTLGASISCGSLSNRVTDTGLDVSALHMTRGQWATLAPAKVASGEIVVMGFSDAEASNAFLIPLGAASSPAIRQVLPVDPQLVGLYYYGLGTLPPGEYGMSIGELVPVSNLAADPIYSWRARLVHFVVSAPAGSSSEAGSSASTSPLP